MLVDLIHLKTRVHFKPAFIFYLFRCNFCANISVYTCYDCNIDLCQNCAGQHREKSKCHCMQLIRDSYTLNSHFRVNEKENCLSDIREITYIKCLPNGLIIVIVHESYTKSEIMTFNVNGNLKLVIPLDEFVTGMDVVDKNTVAVSLKHIKFAIVDIKLNQVQYIDVSYTMQYRLGSCIYIENKLYIGDASCIKVIDMSGNLHKCIDLGFNPHYMCYDDSSQRIYCIDRDSSELFCIDREGTIIFTFVDPNWTNLKGITMDNEGNVLVLRQNVSNGVGCVIKVYSNGKSCDVVISNMRVDSSESIICFHHLTNSVLVVIGEQNTIHIYEKVEEV